MCRRLDALTAEHIRIAQTARNRHDLQTLARELLRRGVKLETAGRVLATRDHRQIATITTAHS